jgi:hypothetical protein
MNNTGICTRSLTKHTREVITLSTIATTVSYITSELVRPRLRTLRPALYQHLEDSVDRTRRTVRRLPR